MIANESRGLRKLLTLLVGLLLVGTVGCGGGGGPQRLTDGAGNGGGGNPSNGVPVVSIVYGGGGYQVSVTGVKNLHSVLLEFAASAPETYILSKKGTCFSPNRDALVNCTVMSKGGDYWYFDNAGNPMPNDGKDASWLLGRTLGVVGGLLKAKPAIKPVIKVTCKGGPYDKVPSRSNGKATSDLGDVIVGVVSSDLYTEVKIATVEDVVVTFNDIATVGEYDTQETDEVEAVRVTLAADGSKWYFDAAGNPLPLDSKWYTDLD